MDNENILEDLIKMKKEINNVFDNMLERITKENNNKNTKNKCNKKNDVDEKKNSCIISLFEDKKNEYNKNVNDMANSVSEFYNEYISIDKNFKKGDKPDESIIKIYIDKTIKNGEYEDSPSNKKNIRNRIKRSIILYDTYGEELKKIYFRFNKMTRLYNDEWDDWFNNDLKNFMIDNKL